MTGFSLQPATKIYAADIRKLVIGSNINPLGLDWRRFTIAVDAAGEMIGCGQLKPHRDGSVELASIAVRPEWRRQGVASTIIEHLIDRHGGSLYLTCRPRLESFYEQFGFQTVGGDEMPAYFRMITRITGFLSGLNILDVQPLVMYRNGG